MSKYTPLISEFGSAEQEAAYDAWFRKKVQEALDDPRPGIPHDEVMAEMRAIVDKARARADRDPGFEPSDESWYTERVNEYSPLISEFGSAEEEAAYDAWLKAKVAKAIASDKPRIPHDEAMARVRATLERAKARAK